MKNAYRSVFLFSVLLIRVVASSIGAEAGGATVGERAPPERLELKVLKVFEAKDGEAVFRAYLVRWKNQEVIVSDPLARSNHKEGDTITVLAMNHPFPQGKEPYRLLGFTVIPPQVVR
jgi:hypothetical protein